MTITYTPFTMDLYDDVYQLWQSSEGVGLSEADSRENIEIFLQRNSETSIVAKIGEGVAGVCLGGFDGRRGYIHHLAVADQYRRTGLGKQLVAACLERFRDMGVQKCHVFIFTTNKDGIEFWKTLGWTERKELGVMSMNLEEKQDEFDV